MCESGRDSEKGRNIEKMEDSNERKAVCQEKDCQQKDAV